MLLAIHVADAVLRPEWWAVGWFLAIGVAIVGCYRLRTVELPHLAMVTAIFFMASSVHVPIGIGRAHLLLIGLVGSLAGWRSGLVILAGLFLQNRLIGHGGLLSLGFNTVAMAVPAILIGLALRHRYRIWTAKSLSLFGLVAGGLGVVMTVGLSYLGLYFGSAPEWRSVTWVFLVVHIPVVIVEALLTAAVLCFLGRSGYSFSSPRGITSSSDTSH